MPKTVATEAIAKARLENRPNCNKGDCVRRSTTMKAAKATTAFAKENEHLIIVGALMGDEVLDAARVQALAKLPSLDELRGKLVGLILAPATKIAGVAQAPAGQLARVVGAYAAKAA